MHAQDGVEVLASLEEDFYKGYPVITKNEQIGQGVTYYVGTSPEIGFIMDLCISENLVQQDSMSEKMTDRNSDKYVEKVIRINGEKEYTFLLNHNEDAVNIVCDMAAQDILSEANYSAGEIIKLDGYGVVILLKKY